MLRNALRFLVRAAVVVGVAASFSTGCSRQAEGERCDFTWAGDQDCDDGLVCTPCGKLQTINQVEGAAAQRVSRCCLPNGTYTDTRCIPTTSPTEDVCNTHVEAEGTGGTGGTGGTTSEGGNGASSEGGNGATSGAAGVTDGG